MARTRRGAGSESAGYHYDATPKRARRTPTRTPVVAPSRSQAARGPAGDYAGADRDYATAVAALPPKAQAVTERATRDASRRRARAEQTRRVQAAATRSKTRRRSRSAAAERRVKATEDRVKAHRTENPAKAVIGTTPDLAAKPPKFAGKPTAGTPTRGELQRAKRQGTLRTNKGGAVTTPRVRKVSQKLHRAEARAPKPSADVAGIQDPEIRHAITRYGHRVKDVASQYGISGQALLSKLVKGESGEDQGAVSSASAKSITQFIPSTRDDFVNRFGIDPWRSKREAVLAATMHLDGKHGYSPGLEGYNPGGGEEYVKYILDQPVGGATKGPTKATPAVRKARRAAAAVGLPAAGKKPALGKIPKKVMTRFKAAKVAMKEVEGLPYVWGGGHGSPTSSPTGGGLDCSGAVGYVLNKIGAMKGSLTSGDMGSVLKPGPGAITVFYNANHTFLRWGDEYWGTSVGDSGSGGLGPHDAPSSSYLSEYSVGHVPGLGKKVAVAMGLDPSGGGGGSSFPGMTLSSSGTTATIAPGAGTTVSGKPRASQSPIRLSASQKARRTLKQLDAAGVGVGAEASTPSSTQPGSSATLSALERKYGVSAQ